jgi:hypothetical protein
VKQETYQHYLRQLSPTDNTLWKLAKKGKSPQQANSPIRSLAGKWARTDQEKAELFTQYFKEVFQPHSDDPNPDVEKYLDSPLQTSKPIKHFTYTEVYHQIQKLNKKKAPGFELINGRVLSELPVEGIISLVHLYNAVLRLKYWPLQLKLAQIIVVPKPGKPLQEVSSYRPISLLPVISKLLEKLLITRLLKDNVLDELLPDHQFGFRRSHSTTQQCHRIITIIHEALNAKEFCPTVYLDVKQAFDKVWHRGLLYKIKLHLPSEYYLIFKSYLTDRHFQIKHGEAYSSINHVNSGVPQGSVFGPLLYLIYTADIPTTPTTHIGTFADDTVLMSRHHDPQIAAHRLQVHLNLIQKWLQDWRIQVNEAKSTHVVYTLRRADSPGVYLNNVEIPRANVARYLGLHLDDKMTWKIHITKKRKEMDIKLRQMYWFLGKKSSLSIENKLLLYKAIIKPIWTYGIELWGCSSKSNVNIIQRFQSKSLRMIAGAPWYVSNQSLHADLKIATVEEERQKRVDVHFQRLQEHDNRLANALAAVRNPKRLKRLWPCDLKGR